MGTLNDVLLAALHRPQPEALVGLQESLLALPIERDTIRWHYRERALGVSRAFYSFLIELQSKTTSRDYNQLASWLDIGAVGVVAFDRLLTQEVNRFMDLVPAILAETLMVIASRQYIKAWEVEARLIYRQATWNLRDALWRLTEDFQPDLPAVERLALIRGILAPLDRDDVLEEAKIVLLGRLYQALLQVYVGRLVTTAGKSEGVAQ